MEYFTRAWAMGDLRDEDADEVVARYGEYISSLEKDGPVCRFVTTISLNDAFIDRFSVTEDALVLRLLTGDLQRGYWHTLITYGGGRIVAGQQHLERALEVRPTEIWYDEFSGAPPKMIHRFLLVKPGTTRDRGEVHLEFEGFTFSETPAAGRKLESLA